MESCGDTDRLYPSTISLQAFSKCCKCFQQCIIALNIFIHRTTVSAAKTWRELCRHCSKMSPHRCHERMSKSDSPPIFLSFQETGKKHTYLLDFDESFSQAGEWCFIGSIIDCNDQKCFHLSSFLWQFNHASSLYFD